MRSDTGGTALIRLEEVTKVYPGTDGPAVQDLTLGIPEGELVCLIGPSGCGKTTILKMVNRLIEPTSGRVLVGGRDIREAEPHELRRGMGYVIQSVGLFAHRTVADNIATVPRLLGWDTSRIAARTEALMDLVGLSPELGARYPHELSGGQQQRVGVARALAADPPILLMDEPFGAVDPIVRLRLQQELRALQDRLHKTIVFVTHDIDEAAALADRVAVMNVGGVVEQYGPPAEVLAEPATPFVEGFLGAERGLRRLSLVRVGDIPLQRGPVVEPAASTAEARKVMERYGVEWVGIADGDELHGWVWGKDLAGAETVSEAPRHRFRVWTRPDATLREALDAVITSRTRVAVVFDHDDRYLGMLSVEQIAEELP